MKRSETKGQESNERRGRNKESDIKTPRKTWGPVLRRHRSLLKCEYLFPIVLHADDGPAFGGSFVERLVELSDGGFAIVGVLTLGVGVVDQEHEAGACACG